MAVHTKASQLQADLDACLRRVRGRAYANFTPTQASISTMTITASTNVARMCRDSLMIALSLVEGDGPLTAHVKQPRKRQKTAFFNQVTLRHGTKSVKVFDNGSMHVTGCTSLMEFVEVSSAVCALIGDTAGILAKDGKKVGVVDFEVQMINLNFGAGMELYLQGLRDSCISRGFVASYDADTYPGLNVKMPIGDRRVTALLFKSGKVIVTGSKTAAEVEEAFQAITSVLEEAAHMRPM